VRENISKKLIRERERERERKREREREKTCIKSLGGKGSERRPVSKHG
jgi:hypothetical protein